MIEFKHNQSNFALVKVSFKTISRDTISKRVLMEVFDLTAVYRASTSHLQQEFQSMLTNALSHERLTPLNNIINTCQLVHK